jgi:hypothetical protein
LCTEGLIMEDTGFERLDRRALDVIELTAEGATDEEMAVLADVLDELETEEKATEFARQMRGAGLLW